MLEPIIGGVVSMIVGFFATTLIISIIERRKPKQSASEYWQKALLAHVIKTGSWTPPYFPMKDENERIR